MSRFGHQLSKVKGRAMESGGRLASASVPLFEADVPPICGDQSMTGRGARQHELLSSPRRLVLLSSGTLTNHNLRRPTTVLQ